MLDKATSALRWPMSEDTFLLALFTVALLGGLALGWYVRGLYYGGASE